MSTVNDSSDVHIIVDGDGSVDTARRPISCYKRRDDPKTPAERKWNSLVDSSRAYMASLEDHGA